MYQIHWYYLFFFYKFFFFQQKYPFDENILMDDTWHVMEHVQFE